MKKKTYVSPVLWQIKKGLCFLFMCSLITSCSYKSELEQALDLAGDNRKELERVLDYYKNDTIKYKAACYLIENMIYHYSIENKNVYSNQEENDLESVYNLNNIAANPDIIYVNFEFLTSHIDHVFGESTNYPGHEKYSFEEFCEYILPYRISHEPLEDWIPTYNAYTDDIINQRGFIKGNDSLLCANLSSKLPGPTTITYDQKLDYKPTNLLKIKKGSCKDYTIRTRYIMQSIQIPVACDFTPNWANRSMGHFWSALVLPNKKAMSFLLGDHSRPFGEHIISKEPDKAAKVYRNTFGIQTESLFMQKRDEDIPAFFRSPYNKDVSDEYFDTVDITLTLSVNPPEKKEFAYIMIFDNKNWTPIHWGRIAKKKVTFTKMAKGCMYMAMYYHNNDFYPAADPFYVDNSGKIIFVKANKTNKYEEITITRKYPDIRMLKYTDRMLGGVFEGSNQANFTNTTNFHTIETQPEVAYQTIELNNNRKFQYIRYIGKEWSFGNIAEMEFYTRQDGEIIKLAGQIIGTDGSYDNSADKTKDKVFDGDPLTFFDGPDHKKCWVGLDLGKPYEIVQIRYLPRNDDNTIRIGDEYELFYWDTNGWKSLGKQIAKEHALRYKDVPANALFLLHNITRGVEERVFTYESNKQVWW